MKTRILIADGFDKNLFTELCDLPHFDVHPEAKNSQEKIRELLPDIEGQIRSATTVDGDFLEIAKNLKYVIRAGEGTDNIDKVLCEKKGVKVSILQELIITQQQNMQLRS